MITVAILTSQNHSFSFYFIFLRFYLFILERGREGEKYQCVVASRMPPTGDLTHNPGMCPDWESNLQPFASQSSTQSTEPHSSHFQLMVPRGHVIDLSKKYFKVVIPIVYCRGRNLSSKKVSNL